MFSYSLRNRKQWRSTDLSATFVFVFWIDARADDVSVVYNLGLYGGGAKYFELVLGVKSWRVGALSASDGEILIQIRNSTHKLKSN